ncbi:hypothetical protein M8C21_029643 [Ambrosia artemisiifolia]|uniref:Uncharacterized protein n=1 Tax=Ambrosia artemisiifolia TaxID=4212 RepID=A0AAD5CQX2_AMBAR|nr:hypothetical protein M8C21_029643 [Ambrosia artemisiifolia]
MLNAGLDTTPQRREGTLAPVAKLTGQGHKHETTFAKDVVVKRWILLG